MDDQRCSLADSEPTPDPSNRGDHCLIRLSNCQNLTFFLLDALNRPRNGGGHAEVQGKHTNGVQNQVTFSDLLVAMVQSSTEYVHCLLPHSQFSGERRASRPDSWRPIEPLERAARSLGGSSRPDKEQTGGGEIIPPCEQDSHRLSLFRSLRFCSGCQSPQRTRTLFPMTRSSSS